MNKSFRFIVLLVGIGLSLDVACHLIADILWYQEVGYLSEFWLRLKTQLGLWAIALITFAYIFTNLSLAQRFKHSTQEDDKKAKGQKGNTHLKLGLRSLLPILLTLSLVIGLMLLQYIQIAIKYWHIDSDFSSLPIEFQPNFIWQIGNHQIPQSFALGALLCLVISILIYPQFILTAIAILISLSLGLILSANYAQVLEYFHRVSFNYVEPLFQKDISFYVFNLPVWKLIELWFLGLFLYSLLSVTLIYMLSGNSLSQGIFLGFSYTQRRHLNGIGGLLMLTIALRYWLRRYELLFSTRGVNYGASYTEVKVQLPIYTGLSFLAVAIAFYLLWRMIFLSKAGENLNLVPYPRRLVYGMVLYLLIAAVTGSILPAILQPLLVEPNELARERPYIERTIALTRQAFDLENIEVQTFNPKGKLSFADLEKNSLTIRNIRLWDSRPLLDTNRQLQQIRPYYKFPNADIDRYTLIENAGEAEKLPITEKQQVIVAARELDYISVPEQAKTWVNEHLVYTHGYGFTVSPVNIVVSGGLPDYFVKDIGIDSGTANNGVLGTSSDRIRASIPIGNPRIYYGEIANTYLMTGTRVSEFDYPSGNDNTYNIYDGSGGISIGSWWRRLVFAETLKDWQILLTQNFSPKTKLLFRRNIKERVKAIAPFLRYDSDPYLVVADTGKGGEGRREERGERGRVLPQNSLLTQNYLYWVIDAYTTSDRYPYSDPGENKFNYIRNSVKVVIDAYNGSVNFYIADTRDPIIASLNAIFPKMFKSLDHMPSELRNHIRYPVDLFSMQCDRLLSYHMTDAQVFYNREDQWQVPSEIYGSKAQPVQPYYLIMKLPTATAEEFILLLPFTPSQRTNLIAWLAARSDGEEYGKLLLYEFPKQQLIYGTEQIEALINQDPVISQQISLWNRAGSRVIQGNLLVIPIERSLLYVEPLYLEAEQNSVPTLARVIVAYQNRIVMAETLDLALKAIFQPEEPTAPAIVRPAEIQ